MPFVSLNLLWLLKDACRVTCEKYHFLGGAELARLNAAAAAAAVGCVEVMLEESLMM